MTAPELLREIELRGVVARVEAGALKLRPAAALDARVLAEIRIAKPAIIALLRKREYSQRSAASLFDEAAAPDAPELVQLAPASGASAKHRQSSATAARRAARVFDAGAAYDATEAAAEAWRQFRAGEVTPDQREQLLAYAAASTRAAFSDGAPRR